MSFVCGPDMKAEIPCQVETDILLPIFLQKMAVEPTKMSMGRMYLKTLSVISLYPIRRALCSSIIQWF